MTTGDYVLWLSAFMLILAMGGMWISFMKFAVNHVDDWAVTALMGSVMFVLLVAIVLSPTYYLVVSN